MADCTNTQPITVVSACMRPDGTPTFAICVIRVSQDERENGVHYYHAEADLLQAGLEEPFVHFDETEAPAFLIPAVRDYLAVPTPSDPAAKEAACPA